MFVAVQYALWSFTCSAVFHRARCLGQLFILYTADLVALVHKFSLSPHLYADDTQIYGACSPANVDWFLSNVNKCLSVVADWMHSNCLQLNSDKNSCGVRLVAANIVYHQQVRLSVLLPSSLSSSARDLGVFINSDLSMETHIKRTVSRCFSTLQQLRSIRRQVPTAVFQSLIVPFVLSRLDYCNSVLAGLPANLIRRLQSVQNAASTADLWNPSLGTYHVHARQSSLASCP